MPVYLITYDLIGPNRDYAKMIEKITSYNGWAHPLESVWTVVSDKTAKQVADDILSVMDPNDKLLVTRMGATAWSRTLDTKQADWMKRHIK